MFEMLPANNKRILVLDRYFFVSGVCRTTCQRNSQTIQGATRDTAYRKGINSDLQYTVVRRMPAIDGLAKSPGSQDRTGTGG